jgi:hypothetical protein
MAKKRTTSITCTKNYRLFERNSENRALKPKEHKRLLASMKRYGFLACFPIVCSRNGQKRLVVKEGQHRLAFAEELGLPVYYVVEDVDFDIAVINCTAKVWGLRDYAEKYAANNVAAYQEGLEFAESHRLPIGTAFALLGGTTSISNMQSAFIDGTFKVKDREWADVVASVYCTMVALAPRTRSVRFVEACMAICRVVKFDPNRMIRCAERCREKLVPYSTRDAYLDMLEEVYNYGQRRLVGLKAAALQAMKDRSPIPSKKPPHPKSRKNTKA